eukprot:Clim_evm28s253 gene=Clim_evmTU28s253
MDAEVQYRLKAADVGGTLDLSELSLRGIPVELTVRGSGSGSIASRIISFAFNRNYITEIPKEFLEAATQLEKISVVHNRLERLPKELGFLKNLQILSLSENALKELPDEVCDLTELTVLGLGQNQLTKLPENIGQLVNLRELWLHRNNLTTLPESMGNLVELRIVWLYDNDLESLPEGLGNLNELQELWLDDNSITTIPAWMSRLTSLQNLWIEGNGASVIESGALNFPSISVLGLGRNELGGVIDDSIGSMQTLTVLHLKRNNLTKVPVELGNLENLSMLNLAHNQLQELPDEIGNLRSLVLLAVNHNNLTDLPYTLARCSKLTTLHLNGNPWSADIAPKVKKGPTTVMKYLAQLLQDATEELLNNLAGGTHHSQSHADRIRRASFRSTEDGRLVDSSLAADSDPQPDMEMSRQSMPSESEHAEHTQHTESELESAKEEIREQEDHRIMEELRETEDTEHMLMRYSNALVSDGPTLILKAQINSIRALFSQYRQTMGSLYHITEKVQEEQNVAEQRTHNAFSAVGDLVQRDGLQAGGKLDKVLKERNRALKDYTTILEDHLEELSQLMISVREKRGLLSSLYESCHILYGYVNWLSPSNQVKFLGEALDTPVMHYRLREAQDESVVLLRSVKPVMDNGGMIELIVIGLITLYDLWRMKYRQINGRSELQKTLSTRFKEVQQLGTQIEKERKSITSLEMSFNSLLNRRGWKQQMHDDLIENDAEASAARQKLVKAKQQLKQVTNQRRCVLTTIITEGGVHYPEKAAQASAMTHGSRGQDPDMVNLINSGAYLTRNIVDDYEELKQIPNADPRRTIYLMRRKHVSHDEQHLVIIKRLKRDEKKLAQSEILLPRQFSHPHVVGINGFFYDDNYVYVEMPYCEGGTLREYVERDRDMDSEKVCSIVRCILNGLGYLHARGIFHGKLLLDQVLMDKDGSPRLTNLGKAEDIDPEEGRQQDIRGAMLILYQLLTKDLYCQAVPKDLNALTDENAKEVLREVCIDNSLSSVSDVLHSAYFSLPREVHVDTQVFVTALETADERIFQARRSLQNLRCKNEELLVELDGEELVPQLLVAFQHVKSVKIPVRITGYRDADGQMGRVLEKFFTQMVDPRYGLFERKATYYLPAEDNQNLDDFRTIGALLLHAMIYDVCIAAPLAPMIYRYFLGQNPSFEDFSLFDPLSASSISVNRDLLPVFEMSSMEEGGDSNLRGTASHTRASSAPRRGREGTHNLDRFTKKWLESLYRCRAQQMRALREGFYSEGIFMKLAEEHSLNTLDVMLLSCGDQHVDGHGLLEFIDFEEFNDADNEMLNLVKRVFTSDATRSTDLRRFVIMCTGSAHLPISVRKKRDLERIIVRYSPERTQLHAHVASREVEFPPCETVHEVIFRITRILYRLETSSASVMHASFGEEGIYRRPKLMEQVLDAGKMERLRSTSIHEDEVLQQELEDIALNDKEAEPVDIYAGYVGQEAEPVGEVKWSDDLDEMLRPSKSRWRSTERLVSHSSDKL